MKYAVVKYTIRIGNHSQLHTVSVYINISILLVIFLKRMTSQTQNDSSILEI
jgi:hypothetical protein